MFGLGGGEVLLVLVFALIFIGPKKLPELAKGLGKGLREFQKAKDDLMKDVKSNTIDQLAENETDKAQDSAEEDSDHHFTSEAERDSEEELEESSAENSEEMAAELKDGEGHGNDPFIAPDSSKGEDVSVALDSESRQTSNDDLPNDEEEIKKKSKS